MAFKKEIPAIKMAWGSVGLIRETCKEIDRPLLVFDMDAFSAPPAASGEIRRRIEELFCTVWGIHRGQRFRGERPTSRVISFYRR